MIPHCVKKITESEFLKMRELLGNSVNFRLHPTLFYEKKRYFSISFSACAYQYSSDSKEIPWAVRPTKEIFFSSSSIFPKMDSLSPSIASFA